MKHKKRRNPRPERTKKTGAVNPAWERVKERFTRIDRREVLRTGLWFLGAFSVYTVCNFFRLILHVYLYPIVLAVIALVYLYLNGGTFDRRAVIDEEKLPKGIDEGEKARLIQAFYARRKKAKRLLAPMFALIATILIDYIVIMVTV